MAIRLATFNLLHGMPVLGGVPEPPRDAAGRVLGPPVFDDDGPLRRAVAALDADVIGLQEVDVAQPRSGRVHQVRSVAEALHAPHWRFAPSVSGTPGEPGWQPADAHQDQTSHPLTRVPDGETRLGSSAYDIPHAEPHAADEHDLTLVGPLYGVGLVSRLPVLEWRTTRFDASPWSLPLMVPAEPRPRFARVADEPRAAIAAVVSGARGPFTVVNVHLSFVPGHNVRQLRALRAWLAGLPRPLVLLGDLNLPGSLPSRITGWAPLLRQATYPVMKPRAQLDHVLADGFTAHLQATAVAEVRPLPVSDHAAVTVDLDL
jgi:endonuclease/exonuclease/phosphatase family metal-dependent hydrolase